MDEIDFLHPDEKHCIKRKADLGNRLYKMYDEIEETENQLLAAIAKKMEMNRKNSRAITSTRY